ncbi:helix-turn-helix domain-containing protein [Streptomyces sp. NBC_00536]|uniref:helix-turn-helix domain-containing protein n=1 Tax=Streptomyces sp. NBC_00536 TaxID=2975769 RepID=UPI002E804E91|nr:helix-turn-helix transcriptional regulator [Streptomyces sp. NBC_00536]WUC81994.1 helix-turn-helix domain-containing protein [Streptomyces sp. NBC_00536]
MSAPSVRQRRLGAELRSLREAKGLTQEEGAQAAGPGWDKTRLSRVERAQLGIKPDVVRLLLDRYGVSDAEKREALAALAQAGTRRGWWQTYKDIISPAYAELIALEADARSLRSYQTQLIPGLLQRVEYARATIAGINPTLAAGEVEALAQVRLARQSVLTRSQPLEVWAIIHEAVLHPELPPRVMRAQLGHLLEQMDVPSISIQIMPLSASPHPGMSGPFTVLSFSERADLDVVLVEHLVSALYVEDAADVSVCNTAFEHLRAHALPLDKSADLTARIMKDLK